MGDTNFFLRSLTLPPLMWTRETTTIGFPMPQDLVLDGFPMPQIPGTDTIKSIFSEPNQILSKLYLPKNATIGHFEYPRYSQGTDNGSNEFPTAKNLGLDTKIKSLANLEPSQWKTHDFTLFLVLSEKYMARNKNYSSNKSW